MTQLMNGVLIPDRLAELIEIQKGRQLTPEELQEAERLHADVTPAPPPEPAERGRYAIFETPDGGWAIARASGICETCQACGCGEQQEPIPVPAMLVPFITGQAELSPGGAMGMIRKMMGNGK